MFLVRKNLVLLLSEVKAKWGVLVRLQQPLKALNRNQSLMNIHQHLSVHCTG
jgi:hypothetical protein